MSISILWATLGVSLLLPGCVHQANFPVYAFNHTGSIIDVVASIQDKDGDQVYNQTMTVAPGESSQAPNAVLRVGQYTLTAIVEERREQTTLGSVGSSYKSWEIVVTPDDIEFRIAVT